MQEGFLSPHLLQHLFGGRSFDGGHSVWGFPNRPVGKESACSARDPCSIPGSGKSPGEGKGYPGELLQILKDDACESAALNMPANLENSAVATGLEKSVFIPIPKKGNAKNAQITTQLHSFHTLVK